MLTVYLVVTGPSTVRPISAEPRRLNIALMFVALGISLTAVTLAVASLVAGHRARQGVPIPIFVIFGIVALIAAIGDLRIIRSGTRRGTPQLARHLWRMCLAMWIATASFFLGQAKVLPKPIRVPALLVLPPLPMLVTMFYWLWRIRVKRSLRGIVSVSAPEAMRSYP